MFILQLPITGAGDLFAAPAGHVHADVSTNPWKGGHPKSLLASGDRSTRSVRPNRALLLSVSKSIVASTDAHMRSQVGDEYYNHGICTSLEIGNVAGDLERGILYFDLFQIPANAVVTSATLTLYKESGAAMAQNLSVHRVTADWTEGVECGATGQVSWMERQFGVPWGTPGGDVDPVAAGSAVVGAGAGAYSWTITGLVADWVNGNQPNYGMVVKVTDENLAPLAVNLFGSSEAVNPAIRPVLTIEYDTPIACPADMVVDCADAPFLPIVAGNPTLDIDPGCLPAGIPDYTDAPQNQTNNGSCTDYQYTIYRTWSVDDNCGDTYTCLQIIEVEDATAPVQNQIPGALNTGVMLDFADFHDGTDHLHMCPEDLFTGPAISQFLTYDGINLVFTHLNGGETEFLPAPTATDACSDVTVSIDYAASIKDASMLPCTLRVNLVWTMVDACGNSSQFEQLVTIEDRAPLAISPNAPNLDVTISCTGDPGPMALGGDVVNPSEVDDMDVFWDFDGCVVNIPIQPQGAPMPGDLAGLYWEDTQVPGACPQEYTINRSWWAVDECGNVSAPFLQVITVDDNMAPVITCPAQVTVECDDDMSPANTGSATAMDDCGPSVITYADGPQTVGPAPNLYTINRTWTATDACGNDSTCLQLIRVNDVTLPTIQCPPNVMVNTDGTGLNAEAILWGITADNQTGDCAVILSGTAPLSDDNCDIVSTDWTLSNDISGVTTNGSGKLDGLPIYPYFNSVTYMVFDGGGNMAMCSFTIQVLDNEAPIITDCNSGQNTFLPADANCQAVLPDWTSGIQATDNCTMFFMSPPVVTQDPVAGTVLNGPNNDYIVTFTVTDNFNNSSTCTLVAHVMDVTPPVADCVDPFTVVLVNGQYTLAPAEVDDQSSDNCGIQSLVVDPSVFTCSDAGETIEVTLTVTDVVGLTNTCTTMVTVKDPNPPVITNCHDNIMVGNDPDVCGAKVNWSPTQAIDDCENASGITIWHWTTGATVYGGNDVTSTFGMPATPETSDDPLPGTGSSQLYNFGLTQVHIIAVDESMNISEVCVFDVMVLDTQEPELIACPEDVTVSTEPGVCSGLVPDLTGGLIATDNCPLEFTQDPVAGSSIGTAHGQVFDITVSATDSGDHVIQCIVKLTLDDTEAPLITSCPADLTVDTNPGTCTGTVPDLSGVLDFQTSDNCVIIDTIQAPLAGSFFGGQHDATQEVTLVVHDVSGNVSDTCRVNLTLRDAENPVIAVCPPDVTVSPNLACSYALPNYFNGLDISDNCTADGDLIQLQLPSAGTTFGSKLGGTQDVEIFLTDQAGNFTSCAFTVTLKPTPAPIVSVSDTTYCNEETLKPVTAVDPSGFPGATFKWFTNPGLTIPVPPAQISGANGEIYTPTNALGIQTVYVVTMNGTCNSDPVVVRTTVLDCNLQITDPCICQDNATTLTNGQFGEVIRVTAPSGQLWTIASVSGLYRNNSPAPPAAPIAFLPGTLFTEFPQGNGTSIYELVGKHVDALGYTLTATNGLVVGNVSNTCYYPDPTISDLVFDNYCTNYPPVQLAGTATYPTQPAIPAVKESDRFDILNPIGVVVQSNITVLNPASLIPGDYFIRYRYNAADDQPTVAFPGCVQDVLQQLTIFPNPPLDLNCNNKANVSLDENGIAVITGDDILEGSYGCYDQYVVEITGKFQPLVDCGDVGKTFTVKVIDPISGNSCWGKIFVEDKLPPVLTCNDVTVSCNDDALDPGSIGYPDLYDNCGVDNVNLTYSEMPEGLTCDPQYAEILHRVWYATDKHNGMMVSCMQDIYLMKSTVNDVVFPQNLDDIALPSLLCGNANTTPDSTGRPSINGKPVSGYCELVTSFQDKVVPICDNSYKVMRTWMVMDNCTGAMASALQIIQVMDKQGPSIVCPTAKQVLIVDPSWQGCGATIFAPTVNITDNCTVPTKLTIQTSVLAGGVLTQKVGNGAHFNVPYGNHTVSYTATDNCGNISSCSVQVTIIDTEPPVAVCNDQIVVSLIESETVVYAKTFDDGSHDNCSGDLSFLVRRMDNANCPGNDATAYAPSVPFYCCDVLNGPVGVAMKVWVDTDHDGIHDANEPANECMMEVTVNDKIKPMIYCPEDIAVSCSADLTDTATQVHSFTLTPNQAISGAYDNDYWFSKVVTGLPADALITDVQVGLEIDHEVVDQLDIRLISPNGTELVLFNGGGCGKTKANINVVFDDAGNPFTCAGAPVAISGILQPQSAILSILNGEVPNGEWKFLVRDKVAGGAGLVKKLSLEIAYATPLALKPWVSDNAEACGLDISFTDLDEKAQCAENQEIRRVWRVVDPNGNSQTCIQIIHLTDDTPLIVDFPEDVTITNCVKLNDIQATGEVEHNGDCELVGVSSVDEVYDVVQDACYKIVRTWTVVDWCKFDQNKVYTNGGIIIDAQDHVWEDDGDGYFKWVQTIKVIDNDPPEVICPQDFTIESLSAVCDSNEVTISLPANDACTPVSKLKVNWTLDLFNDGNVNMNGTGLDFTRAVPRGTHKVYYHVSDGCGNFTNCSFLFTVVDKKKPTPICQNGISVDLMPSTGEVLVPAVAMESGDSYDNCTVYENLTILAERFTDVGVNQKVPDAQSVDSLLFTCADYEAGNPVAVAVWVGDEAGNWDLCVMAVDVQNNMGAPCDTTNFNGTISGSIQTEWDKDVEEVSVSLAGPNIAQTMSAANGWFNFSGMVPGNSYTIVPEKDGQALNGVSTYDILLIQKHILGIKQIQTPYCLIAADVNKSNSVSIADIVSLRKTLLTASDQFTDNTSWRFVDEDFIFTNPTNPWKTPFPETVNVDIQAGNVHAGFVGIKVGDINGDAVTTKFQEAEVRNTEGVITLWSDERALNEGEEVLVPFYVDQPAGLEGFQFTISFDPSLEFLGVENGVLDGSHFGLTFLAEGLIAVSWNGEWPGEATAFGLRFGVKRAGLLSRMLAIHSMVLQAEGYVNEGSEIRFADVDLAFRGQTKMLEELALYQNIPNPFTGHTTIGFHLPSDGRAVLMIHDVSGREVYRSERNYARGYQQIELVASDLPGAGLYYYTLQFKGQQLTRRMSLLD
ncbi:MAG: DNRLRE domain-containing protein [Saprospiraceae bacterium]